MLLQFCQLTGADPETATHYLEAMGGNLESAVSMFLDSGGQRPRPSNTGGVPMAPGSPGAKDDWDPYGATG